MASEPCTTVSVLYSPAPREWVQVELTLDAPHTVLQALQQSGLLSRFAGLDRADIEVGVWGRRVSLLQALRDQDRVEVYRPLKVDPKVARRQRFVRQGSRRAGLFVKQTASVQSAL